MIMYVKDMYQTIKNDAGFQSAVKHNSANEIRMILNSMGYSFSFDHADALLDYAQGQQS
jgi:hypothetical protein